VIASGGYTRFCDWQGVSNARYADVAGWSRVRPQSERPGRAKDAAGHRQLSPPDGTSSAVGRLLQRPEVRHDPGTVSDKFAGRTGPPIKAATNYGERRVALMRYVPEPDSAKRAVPTLMKIFLSDSDLDTAAIALFKFNQIEHMTDPHRFREVQNSFASAQSPTRNDSSHGETTTRSE